MRFLISTAMALAAAALTAPAASAEVTDPAGYKEAVECAASMTVAAAAMAGTDAKPASAEMQKASEDAKGLALKWLVRADNFNQGNTDATIEDFKAESDRQGKALINAKGDDEFNTMFRDRFRTCLARGNELKF